jgi:hypothetical protein
MPGLESPETKTLQAAYREFNARDIDAVLARMQPDVEWANGMEGGHVIGREAVRAYWTHQFSLLNPRVDPMAIESAGHGALTVEVHQVVHDIAGNLVRDTTVYHTYRFRDGLIARMDITQELVGQNT